MKRKEYQTFIFHIIPFKSVVKLNISENIIKNFFNIIGFCFMKNSFVRNISSRKYEKRMFLSSEPLLDDFS